MKITLKNKKYQFLTAYQDEITYRSKFNHLANRVFGISFEDWYQMGHWKDKYISYTLFDGDVAVANVSVNIMDFNVLGKQEQYLQIGTVMTDEAYRNNGLSRFLMEKVLQEWSEKCSLIYLYANPSAVAMYPKFGFTPVKEYANFKTVSKVNHSDDFEKLNMGSQSNRDKLYEYASNTNIFGKIYSKQNADLLVFYCASFLKDHVYYNKLLDVIAVAKVDQHQLHLMEVFGNGTTSLDEIIDSLSNSQTKEILLGFTPKDCGFYQEREISGGDTLFIHNNKTGLFDNNHLMFPELSHA